MAILQAILTGMSRAAGRILNTAFGWATVMLFGKVPQDRQIYLSVLAFGSVIWLVVVVGIAFPAVGTFLLAFAPLPKSIDPNWIRLAMLAAALLVPLLTGLVSLNLLDTEDRPKGREKLKAIGRGYLLTLGLAITLVLLTAFAPILKAQTMSRRWISEHVPILVEPNDYEDVVEEVQRALEVAGWKTSRRPISWMLSFPTRVLTFFAGNVSGKLIGDRLVTLASRNLEVMLHPSDMVISGKKLDVTHVRAALMEQLAFSRAYLTWDKDGNALEDRIRHVWHQIKAKGEVAPDAVCALQEIEKDLRNADLPYEEWQVLSRGKLLVERGMLQMTAGFASVPPEPTDTPPEKIGAAQIAEAKKAESGGWLVNAGTAAALAVMAWFGFKGPGHPRPGP